MNLANIITINQFIMKRRYPLTVLTLILAMGFSSAQAQVKLVVTAQNGGKTSEYALQDIQKIYFGEDGMHITGTTPETESIWKLSEVKNIQFTHSTTGIGQAGNDTAAQITISLIGNQLFVSGLNPTERANATIFNISGQTVLRAKAAEGEPIDVSRLNTGAYIIKVNNETLKFVKQ